jgi:acetyl-CoA C-acetyltransferase
VSPKVDPRTPCLIGVSRKTWHRADVGEEGAPEPLAMWEEVARAAACDAGSPDALRHLQSLQVIYSQSWQYDDPPARLAQRLDADPAQRLYSGIGGSTPQVLAGQLTGSIARGELDLGLIVGAEALSTVRQLKKAGSSPQWSYAPEKRPRFPFDIPFHPAEVAHGIFEAYLTFALFDNARRAHRGTALDEHRGDLGQLLAPMSALAAEHPEHSWFPTARSAAEITGVTTDNRMVAYPYAKLMVSIMDVDMAAALLIASTERADALGVPEEQRIYLRGWAYAEDPYYVAERRDLWRSAGMKVAAADALAQSGIGPEDVAHLDLYSCFSSSVDFALDALERARPIGSPPSVTGALPYHGGPGSNYMTHSIAAMAEALRADPGSYGLVSGVGMHMTKHVYAVWSSVPGGYVEPDPATLAARVAEQQPTVAIQDVAEGDARVATYSVLHGRDGAPEWGALVCDLPEGSRCYARLEDPDTLAWAESEELIGQAVRLESREGGVNIAHLDH